MAIRIFDVDPDAKPRASYSSDIVGRFRSGTQLNNRPLALEEWRVTSGDPEVTDRLAELLGIKGGVQEWDTKGEDNLELFTTSTSVDVILDGPNAVMTSMVLRGQGSAIIRQCDGVEQADGTACACPNKVADRKAAGNVGTGCKPSISIFFKLADDPELGKFRFSSGSWSMAGEIGEPVAKLEAIGGPARGTLSLEKVEYTTKAGRHVEYTKPVLTVRGPVREPESVAKVAPTATATGRFGVRRTDEAPF